MNKSDVRMKRSTAVNLRKAKHLPSLLAVILIVLLNACGGGGTSASPPASSTTVNITGSLSQLAKAKPSADFPAVNNAVAGIDWAGTTLQVVDASGAVIGTGTVHADGTYSVSVPPGGNYFIRVQTGNLVLKAFLPSVTASTSMDITPTTTAQVIVLAQVLGVANAGEPGVSVSTALAPVNVNAVMTQITVNPNVATVATALAAGIAAGYNATSSTPSIGAADVSVTTIVASISATVSTTGIPAAPSPPAGIGVTAGDGQAGITWSAVSGATHYNVYYRTAANVTTANGTKVANAVSGGAITGLTNGAAYYFVVTAANAGGESSVSSEVGATPQVPAAGAPTGVSASGGNGKAVVSWTAVAGATSYNVYYRTTSGVTAANGTIVANAVSGGAITGLTNGTTYYFVVTAKNAGGESSASSEVGATPQVPAPGAPTGVLASGGNGQAVVSWTAVTGAVSYNVYYRTSAGVTTVNGTKVANAVSGGAITGLTNGAAYYFVVTAANAGGESPVSSEASATPQIAAPTAPTGITVTGGDAQAAVSWTAAAGATSYNVYYRTTSGVTAANGTKVAGATSGGAVTGLTNGVIHYFAVTAVNAGGESTVSAQVYVRPESAGVWTTKLSMVNQRDNAANAVMNGIIYVLGGAPAGTGILDSMEAYDPAANTWTTKAVMPAWSATASVPTWAAPGTPAATPAYRYGPSLAPVNGLLYLIGGTSMVNGQGPISPIAVYDPVGNAWSSIVPVTAATIAAGTNGQALAPFPTPRWGFDTAVVDGVIYAIGGCIQTPTGVTIAKGTKIAAANPAGTVVTGLLNNHVYCFATSAVTGATESALSTEVCAIPEAAVSAAIPTRLTAVAGNGQVTLSWTAPTTPPASYNIYYSTSRLVTIGGAGVTMVNTATANAVIGGLTNGTTYYFRVTDNLATVANLSLEMASTPQAAAPAGAPTGLTVTPGAAQVTLSWTPVGGAASHNVYYGNGFNIYYGTIEAYDPVANIWTTKAPMPTPRYGSTVSVVNGLIYAIGGWGGWPELAMVEIYNPATNTWSTTVPANTATTALGTAGAALTPMPTARDDFGYAVLNGVIYAIGGDINAFNNAARTPCCTTIVEAYDTVTNRWVAKTAMPTQRDDFDASVVDGVIYGIAGSRDGVFSGATTVNPDPALDAAWMAANNGGFSLTVNEAFSISTIPVPGGVAATAGANQATLTWNAVTGATSYNIYWSNKAGVSTTANSAKITGVTSPHVHTGLTAGMWYYYVVTAVTASGESLPSNEVAVKP